MLPPSVAEVGEQYSDLQTDLVEQALALVVVAIRRGRSSPEAWRDAIQAIATRLLSLQVAAASYADAYLNDVLEAQGADPFFEARVDPRAFADLYESASWLQSLVFAPNSVRQSDTQPGSKFEFVATSIVKGGLADVARSAVQTGMQARPAASWYVRMLRGKSCARCAVLAGRRYRSSHAFDRHRRCDCIHIPAAEDSEDWATDPNAYFRSLSAEGQDRLFTKAGAQAIRDGADIHQIVNARRGAHGLTPAGARITAEEAEMLRGGRAVGRLQAVDVYGRPVYTTTEGVTVRGLAGKRLADGGLTRPAGSRYRRARTPRLMPESLYELAESREDAVRLLRRFGYLL